MSVVSSLPCSSVPVAKDLFARCARHPRDHGIVIAKHWRGARHLADPTTSEKAALLDFNRVLDSENVRAEIERIPSGEAICLNHPNCTPEWARPYPELCKLLIGFGGINNIQLVQIVVHAGGEYERAFGGTHHTDYNSAGDGVLINLALNLFGAGMRFLVGPMSTDAIKDLNKYKLLDDRSEHDRQLKIQQQQSIIMAQNLCVESLNVGQGLVFPTHESGKHQFHGAPQGSTPRKFISGRYRIC